MAFGYSPKYIQDVPLENLTPAHFLVLAIEAAKKLEWNIGYMGENGFIAYTQFSMSSWSEEIKVKVEHSFASLKSECTGNQLADWGKNKKNIEELIDGIETLKTSVTPEDLDQKYEEFKPGLAPANEYALSNQPITVKEKINSVLSIFVPTRGYFVTPIIININILIFILMAISGANVMSPDTQTLLKWGANFRPATIQDQWWRLITNFFLHIGIFHLLFNMYALVYIGLLLEHYLGKIRFAAAYMLTGIAASTASLYWHEMVISAGASGAIFGMYGIFLAMLTTNLVEASARRALLTSIGVFVLFNLMNGMKGGIDNAAHIGGLISGFVIGYIYYPGLKEPTKMDLKLGVVAVITIGVVLLCFLVCKRIPNDIAKYEEKMKSFATVESMALELYNDMPQNTSRESLLEEINNRGIYYWNRDIEIINEVEKLNLPETVHKKDRKLIYYCNLRIKSYKLIYKAIDEKTDKYKDSILLYNKQIKDLIDSFKE